MPSLRTPGYSPFALVAFACAALMGYALFAQHVQGFEPCMLCMVQRVFVCATGLVALIAVLHRPGVVGRRVYGILGALMAGTGAYVAGRHVYLQQLALTAPEQLDGCAPSFEYALQNYGLPKFLGAIFIRDQDCGVIDWTFLGLSMPAWVLIWFVVIALVLLWAGFRRMR
ncbi:MAG: disulfide bond formation protein B [Xanthomonadales bacterium]|nr:disulfide bond formation protein B [Xanthomonadales bacterium]